MGVDLDEKAKTFRVWTARIAVALVFISNMSAAVAYIAQPARYTAAYELEGVAGRVVVQAFGILFLMWNATYPPVIFNPERHRVLFIVILAQQAIAMIGETVLLISLPSGHSALYRTGCRFILFDGVGLLVMAAAFLGLRTARELDSSE